MSWADIKRKYEDGGASASQSTEDMAARRILRALGLSEKALPGLERLLGLDAQRQADTTLLERTDAVAQRSGCSALWPLAPVRDVKSAQEAEDAVLELAERQKSYAAKPYVDRPVAVVYRVKGSQDLRTKVWLGGVDLLDPQRIPLPCRLYRSRDLSCIIADCNAEDFYKSLVKGAVKWTSS